MALTTISARFESGDYSPDVGGLYKLYHDVKLVCTILIHYHPQGTRNYQMVDKFYKFGTELILRECYKLGASLTKSDRENSVGNEDRDNELNQIIAEDFITISTNYQVPLTQTYHIKTKDQDLFSSSIAKSTLDERPHELPNSNFELNKVIPQTNICEEAPRLGFVAANTSNIPDPTLPPTEMMARFLHPNWYALPTTMWLKYGEYKSWAPSFKENGTVIDSTTRGIIWLERVGYVEMYRKMEESRNSKSIHSEVNVAENDEKKNNDDLEKVSEEKTDQQMQKLNGENGKSGSTESKKQEFVNGKGAVDNDVATSIPASEAAPDGNKVSEPLLIKLENLLDWSPGNYIDDDEIEHLKNGTHDELVSATLLKIKKLRKLRISRKISKPSLEEIKAYYKVRRLLKEVLLAKQTRSLPMKHCRSFPVLQANYNGSIPVVRVQPTRKRKSKK